MDAVSLKLARNYTNEKLNSLPSNRPTKTVSFDGGIYSVGNDVVNGQVSAILKGNTWTNRAGLGDTSPQTIENLDSAKTYLLIKTDGGTVNVDAVDTAVPAKITGKTSTVLTWASGKIALYELSTAEAALTEAQLGARYHYVSGTKSTLSVRVKSVGKNLLRRPYSDGNTEIDEGITFTVQNDGSIRATGTSTDYSYFDLHRSFKARFGTTYTVFKGNGAGKAIVVVPLVNGVVKWTEALYATSSKLTFAATYETYYIAIQISSSAGAVDSIFYPQIELGSISTEYEPYKESIVNVNLPEPLRSLPNGVKDEVSVSDGKKIQRVSDNTSISGTTYASLDTTTYTNIDVVKTTAFSLANAGTTAKDGMTRYYDKNGVELTEIAQADIDNAASVGKYYWHTDKTLWIIVAKGAYADITAARTGLGTMTLNYQLAEPIVTKLPAQAPLQVFENGTVYVEPLGDPSETTLPTVELTAPIAGGNKVGIATHDYAGAAADWTLTSNESKCKSLSVTNAGGAANIIAPDKPGLTFTIKNGSGQAITIKISGGTGVAITNGKKVTVQHFGTDYEAISSEI